MANKNKIERTELLEIITDCLKDQDNEGLAAMANQVMNPHVRALDDGTFELLNEGEEE